MSSLEKLAMWRMGRSRLTNQFAGLEAGDMRKKIHPKSNSAGWLLRHMGEVEFLFAKNIFGLSLKVKISTVGKDVFDKGNFTDLPQLLEFLDQSGSALESAIGHQPDESWGDRITTVEFGTITKAEALARITTHTAWHAGQLAIIKKYGAPPEEAALG